MTVSYAEAFDLVAQLMREPRSHLHAKMRGLTEAQTDADIASILLAQSVLNAFRPKDTDPVRFPLPFVADEQERVTPEEYAKASAHLAAHSAFAD